MTDSINTDTDPASADGVVEHLARDDVERKRFLKMAGKRMGAGAAATGWPRSSPPAVARRRSSSSSASVLAQLGSAAAAAASRDGSRAPPAPAISAIVNYALTLEYLESQFYEKVIKSGLFKGTTLSTLKTFGAEEDQHVRRSRSVAISSGKPAAKPTGKFPLKSAVAGRQAGGDRREPRRRGLPRPGGEHPEQGDPRRGAPIHTSRRATPRR